MHSPYATRTSSGGGGGGGGGSGGGAPVTIQAYANSMANRSPIRDESGAQGVQSQARTGTGSKFADKLAERVKVAAAALEEDQLASGHIGKPSQARTGTGSKFADKLAERV